jgi:hypothetical protein
MNKNTMLILGVVAGLFLLLLAMFLLTKERFEDRKRRRPKKMPAARRPKKMPARRPKNMKVRKPAKKMRR